MAIDYGPVHALTVELHGGFFALAFFAIVVAFVCALVLRLSQNPAGPTTKWFSKVGAYMDAAGFLAALAGVLLLVLSAVTGILADPLSDLLADPLVLNKILLSVIALFIWSSLVFVRATLGRKLWTFPWTALLYTVFAIIGFGLVLTVITLGFTLADGGSVVDPLWSFFGIDLTKEISLGTENGTAVLVGSIAVILVCLGAAWKYRLGTKVVKSDPKESKWKIPKI
jgi:hypothetical protein